MAGSQSKEVFFLKQIAGQKFSEDFQQNVTELNTTVGALSKYLISMQTGIDDLNKDIIETVQDFIHEIIVIFGGGSGGDSGFQFGDLKYIFQALGSLFGLGGIGEGFNLFEIAGNFFNNFLKPIQPFIDSVRAGAEGALSFILDLISGIPFIGTTISQKIASVLNLSWGKAVSAETKAVTADGKAVDAKSTSVVVSNQVNYVTEVINVRSGRAMWESGPDPTGDPSFTFEEILDAGPTVAVTATNAPWGMIRLGGASKKKVATILALKTGTVSSFYLDLYKMDPDGTFNLVQSSTDQSGILGTTMFAMQVTFPGSTIVDLGEVYAVQFRITGSGSVVMPSKVMRTYGFLGSFVPKSMGAARNPSTTPAPATIGPATMSTMYNYTIPWFSLGIDLGAKPTPRYFTDNFNRSLLGDNYILYYAGGTGAPQIENNGLSFSRSAANNGYAGAVWGQPLISDNWFIEWRPQGINDRPNGIFVGGSDGIGFGLSTDNAQGLRLWGIVSPDWSTANVQLKNQYNTGVYKSNGLWRMERTVADNTMRLYKDNDPTPLLEFPDNNNIIPKGNGKRFFGGLVSRFSLGVSVNVDDLTFGDIQVAA